MRTDRRGQIRLEILALELTATIALLRPAWDSNRVFSIDAPLAKDCTHGPSTAICSHRLPAKRYSARNQSKLTPLDSGEVTRGQWMMQTGDFRFASASHSVGVSCCCWHGSASASRASVPTVTDNVFVGKLVGENIMFIINSFISIAYKAIWRRERDSNPRWAFYTHTPLAGERLQPLGHLSTARNFIQSPRAPTP